MTSLCGCLKRRSLDDVVGPTEEEHVNAIFQNEIHIRSIDVAPSIINTCYFEETEASCMEQIMKYLNFVNIVSERV